MQLLCQPHGLFWTGSVWSMRRPALVFDFGNVLAFFDYARASARLARKLGLSGDAFLQQLRTQGLTPLVERYESGRMTSQAFSAAVRDIAGLAHLAHEEFVACWCDIFWLNDPVARLVRDLKTMGYRLVLGSNTNELHAEQFRRQFAEALAPFDRLVLSYEVGHIKPSAKFFHACADAAGTSPSDCIFIDDIRENVEGARAVGMTGIVFENEPALRTDLQRLGIDVGVG
jgi:putative hydrolase of the HAD superfamily